MTDNASAFVPMLTRDEVRDNLSATACRNRDVMRRTASIVLTQTPAELVEAAKADPEMAATVAEIVHDIAEHARAEAELYEAALARLLWAACEAGIAPLADEVADATRATEGGDHA